MLDQMQCLIEYNMILSITFNEIVVRLLRAKNSHVTVELKCFSVKRLTEHMF